MPSVSRRTIRVINPRQLLPGCCPLAPWPSQKASRSLRFDRSFHIQVSGLEAMDS
jgi:hypothetical protein